MAGYIGTVGGDLVAPLVVLWGIDLHTLPAAVILVALVWLIPLAGQIGMNPILAVALLAPLLPTAAAIGIAPNAYVVAITAGWALSGACSPFTATNLLIGNFAGISAAEVGRGWNGLFTLCTGVLLPIWVVSYALVWGVVIRSAGAHDLDAIRTCAETAYTRYIPAIGRAPAPMVADFAAQIAAGQVHVACTEEGELLGYIVFFPQGAAMFLENVAVAPTAAGRAWARA